MVDHIVGLSIEGIKGDDEMGLMDILKKTYEYTNNKVNTTKEKAAEMDTYELVRAWRNCSDPIKKGAYYQEMQTRNDIDRYL